MKLTWNKKYTMITVYTVIAIVIIALVIMWFAGTEQVRAILTKIGSAFSPLLYGVVIAFLINPITKLFDKAFAGITADDKVPEPRPLEEIPEVPVAPDLRKPASFTTMLGKRWRRFVTKDLEEYQTLCDEIDSYESEKKAYKLLNKTYKTDVRERNSAIGKRKRDEEYNEKVKLRALRVQRRHDRINSKTYGSGKPDKRTRYGLRRGLSVLCSVLVALAIVALFVWSFIPQIVSGAEELVKRMPSYVLTLTAWISAKTEAGGVMGQVLSKVVEYVNNFISGFYTVIQNAIPTITNALSSIIITVKDLLIGFCFAVYFLAGKERVLARLKKLSIAILPKKGSVKFLGLCTELNKNFGSFITAKIIDSMIIGVLSLIVLLIFNVPYSPLIALILGVTNIIPIFGPVVGAVIGGFIVLIVDPTKLITFIIFAIIIQQFDGNVLGPRLLGAQVKSTSLGILTALTVMSTFWGIGGLVIAVPVFAVAYDIIKKLSERSLAKKGMSTNTRDYYYDEFGQKLSDEAAIKQDHKRSLKDAIGITGAGRAALKAPGVKMFAEKVDEMDKTTEINTSFMSEDMGDTDVIPEDTDENDSIVIEDGDVVSISEETIQTESIDINKQNQ